MSEALVLRSQTGAVRSLTLNRPAALNSLTVAMHHALMFELDAAARDAQVRCVVLTGAGRGFCAGQDLSDPIVAPDPATGAAPKNLGDVIEAFYRPLALRIRSMPVPVLAVVNGVAAGAGANLALACDVVVAARSASFIQAFSKIGSIPDTGGTWTLPRLAGRARAMGLAMFGDKLPAADAERFGLIWKCVDDAQLAEAAQTLAQRLAAAPTMALVATRSALDAAQHLDVAAALGEEAPVQSALGAAPDYREGVSAFTEKRMPTFADR